MAEQSDSATEAIGATVGVFSLIIIALMYDTQFGSISESDAAEFKSTSVSN
jgi:hypothetical protein